MPFLASAAAAASLASSAITIGSSIASLFSSGPDPIGPLPKVGRPRTTTLSTPGFRFSASPALGAPGTPGATAGFIPRGPDNLLGGALTAGVFRTAVNQALAGAGASGGLGFNLESTGAGRAELERIAAALGVTAEQAAELLATTETSRPRIRGLATSAQALRGQAEERFGSLIDRVRPGFGELTRTTKETFSRRSAEAVGNLRESLSRRRVLGSSFANDAQTRVLLDFAAEEERALAEAKISELGLTADFTTRLFNVSLDTLQVETNAIAQELGLNQQQANILNTNILAIREQRNTVVAGINADLAAFQVGADLAFGLQQLADQNARFDIAVNLEAAKFDTGTDIKTSEAKGESLNTLTRTLSSFGDNRLQQIAAVDIASNPDIFGSPGIGGFGGLITPTAERQTAFEKRFPSLAGADFRKTA